MIINRTPAAMMKKAMDADKGAAAGWTHMRGIFDLKKKPGNARRPKHKHNDTAGTERDAIQHVLDMPDTYTDAEFTADMAQVNKQGYTIEKSTDVDVNGWERYFVKKGPTQNFVVVWDRRFRRVVISAREV